MLNQRLQQKLLQKLSPQQIQLMKLLQVPTIALEQRIKQEIEENPALEEGAEENESDSEEFDDLDSDLNYEDESENKDNISAEINLSDYFEDDEIPSYKLAANNSSPDDDRKDIPYSGGISFQEILSAQLGMHYISEKEKAIAEIIIGNLDDAGYLQRELPALVNDLMFSYNIKTTISELEKILTIIQSFDPAGVGARNLRECLLLQLYRKDQTKTTIKQATITISKCFNEFTKKHYDKIAKKLGISEDDLKGVINEILKLNPKPGNSVLDGKKVSQMSIVPDFFVYNVDGKLELSLNSKNAPELRLSRTYTDMLQSYGSTKDKNDRKMKDAVAFVKQKMDSAKWFIDAVKQRQFTLYDTMEAIMKYQREFFETGEETKIKPMILKDIADMVRLDISTISRVVNSKYVQTEYGTSLLKTFFSESLSTDSGEEVSTIEVKNILQECISNEDKRKPITDDVLASILNEKGYNIARRTVAKYREQLDIPVARMRKEL
ncbi:MAG: RNA polymerase factor sigma-54 [Bacteroidota bacterium]